jgi:thioredoxin reductase (NADPH)
MNQILDLIIVGGGPSGLACAIHAKKHELAFRLIEKGCIVNSIYNYPENMTFFTTAELLEIGKVPFIVDTEKPKRVDALKYYRRVVDFYELPIRDYEKVSTISGRDGNFSVVTIDRNGEEKIRRCRKIILATGYFDNPNLLGIPGEDLDKVSHYYNDAHPYYQKKVAVVGGKNSAAIAALELFRNGADVTLIHRRNDVGREIKYWIRPDILNRIQNQEIKAYFNSTLKEVRLKEIVLATPEGEQVLENDFVFALTGYHPDSESMRQVGIEVDTETFEPSHNPDTLETNVSGIYLAGSVISGKMTNRIFIENGRFHGRLIFPHLVGRLRDRSASPVR